MQGQKTTKAFGAPDSDAEESNEEDEGDDGEDNGETSENDRAASPEKEDKKKPKLQKGIPYSTMRKCLSFTNISQLKLILVKPAKPLSSLYGPRSLRMRRTHGKNEEQACSR